MQGEQTLPAQTRPLHSGVAVTAPVGEQQLPVWQPPLQQSWPRPQSALLAHAEQELPVHTLPAPQSELMQQVPLTHAPLQHFWPAPHCASLEQVPQKPDGLQVEPAGQSAVVQQLPDLQAPPQQTLPGPH